MDNRREDFARLVKAANYALVLARLNKDMELRKVDRFELLDIDGLPGHNPEKAFARERMLAKPPTTGVLTPCRHGRIDGDVCDRCDEDTTGYRPPIPKVPTVDRFRLLDLDNPAHSPEKAFEEASQARDAVAAAVPKGPVHEWGPYRGLEPSNGLPTGSPHFVPPLPKMLPSQQDGYPLVYWAGDGQPLCARCATEGLDRPEEDKEWRHVGSEVHWEGPPHECANCNKPIESAYGDPAAEEPPAAT